MLVSYCLGVFNDNFFRQTAMLAAVAFGIPERQGEIMFVFALPYLLFASHAGWLADRFPKRRVIISAKALELAAMLCGAVGILAANLWLMGGMVFVMGLQSAVFGPSLNGSIPELYPAWYVRRAYAIVKAVVTAMILVGITAAGWVGRPEIAAGVVLAISAVGLVASFWVPGRPAADPRKPLPWSGPIHTVRSLWRMLRDRLLGRAVVANAYIWFLGAFMIQIVNALADDAYLGDEALASMLIGCEMVGVAVGGLLSARLARGEQWHRVLPPAALAMTAFMLLMPSTRCLGGDRYLAGMFALMVAIGVPGGLFMVPCEAFFQIYPPPGSRGTVIAAANFASFVGILLAGPAAAPFNLLIKNQRMHPTDVFAVMALPTAAIGFWLARTLPRQAPAEAGADA